MSSPAQVTLTSGREVTLSTSSQRERILCQKSCWRWRMRSHFYQVGSRIQYICSLQASFRQTALLSVPHTEQTESRESAGQSDCQHIASHPLFIHPFKWRAAKVWRNAGSHQKQTNSHILFLRARHRPTFGIGQKFALFFLSSKSRNSFYDRRVARPAFWLHACTRGVRQNNRQKFERARRSKGQNAGARAHCVALFLCAGPDSSCVRMRRRRIVCCVWLCAAKLKAPFVLLRNKATNIIEFGTGNICA
jgi:hypothetical protein